MEQDISNGNRNDLDWKNKLEDISNFPNAILTNKNASWEKLHNRLHKKRSTQPFWYWLTAACLLLAISFIAMIGNKKQNGIAKNTSEKIPSRKEAIAARSSSKEDTVVNASARANEHKAIQQSLEINEKNSAANKRVIKKKPVYAGFDYHTDIANEPVILPAVRDSAAVNTLAIVPLKKRLKVVHINELDPFDETPNIARQYEQHSFQLKLINPQSNTGISLPSESRGFTIFKTIKASLN